MMTIRNGLLMTAAFALAACMSKSVDQDGMTLISPNEFENVIEAHTERAQKYEGLYNTIDVTATLRREKVLRAQLEQMARAYRWDQAKLQFETNKSMDQAKNETEVFLSFYTPEKKNDDLNRSKTQWRTYLEVDGRRWEGKIKRIKLSGNEIQALYPYNSRFATPYSVTFPISTASTEGKPVKFTVAGPMGLATLEFK